MTYVSLASDVIFVPPICPRYMANDGWLGSVVVRASDL